MGIIKEPKKRIKKEKRNGLTEDQIRSILKQRKIERPPYNILLEEIKQLGYCGVGRKYGVSDNSIRKWKKTYEKINL